MTAHSRDDTAISEHIEAVVSGDVERFSHIIHHYHPRLMASLARYCRPGDELDDLVQEAFVRAFRNLHTFDSQRPFYPWLQSIALNTLRKNIERSETRSRHRSDLIHYERIKQQIDGETLEQNEQECQALRDCLQTMAPKHHRLLEKKYQRESPIEQLAQEYQTTSSAVKMKLLRLRQKLRGCIEQKLRSQP